MDSVMNSVFVILLGIAAFFAAIAVGDSDYNKEIAEVYGVKIVKTERHLFSPNKLIIDRDGREIRCGIPSSGDLNTKAQMNCDDTLKISPAN
jgi:hypothetical protein